MGHHVGYPTVALGASARTGFLSAKPCTVPTLRRGWFMGKKFVECGFELMARVAANFII